MVPELAPLESIVTNFMVSWKVKAGTLSLMKDSKLVMRQGYGWRDTNLTLVAHPDNIMRLASISKPITVCAINKLINEGQISLDTKVYDYVGIPPYTGLLGDPQITNITVRNCLEMSTGLNDTRYSDWQVIDDLGLTRPPDAADWIRWWTARPLLYSPGTSNVYSGTGPHYLARVVEKASGQYIMDYLQQEMFFPCGITDIVKARTRVQDRPMMEIWYDDDNLLRSMIDYPTNKLARSVDGGGGTLEYNDASGGYAASAPALCRFLQHYFLAGSRRDSLYGYWYGWLYVFYGGAVGTATAIHQDVSLQVNSLKALEFALLFNKGCSANEAHDALVEEAKHIASWPASGGGEIHWSLSQTSVVESAGSVSVPLVRDGLNDRAVKVSYTTYAWTATEHDFVPQSGIITFAPGETTRNITVQLINNSAIDGPRKFSLELISASGGGWLGDPCACTVDILDDDASAGYAIPTILFNPVSQVVTQGATLSLGVGVQAAAWLNYQWYQNGLAINQATQSVFCLTNVSPGAAGEYTAAISNPGATNWSAPATIIVLGTNTIQSGGLRLERYTNITGTSFGYLLKHPNFPDFPDQVGVITNFETAVSWGDNYGQRVSGCLTPPVTGNYTFYIASDDQGALWLSTDDNPENLVQIAQEPEWNESRSFITGVNQVSRGPAPRSNISAPIYLVAGKRYYIMALMKEAGGGDNLAVAWQTPGGAAPTNGSTPIPGAYLSWLQLPPVILEHPGDRSASQGDTAVFAARVSGSPPLRYQWFHNGFAIAGATNRIVTLAGAQPADTGQYQVVVANSLGSVTSRVASLSLALGPAIRMQPEDRYAFRGETISLIVKANGNSYQWKRNGTALTGGPDVSGSGTDTLTLANLQDSSAGDYSVAVTNFGGSTASRNARLSVRASVVAGWGYNNTWSSWSNGYGGQIAIPTALSNVVAIGAGWWHSIALQADGKVVCWGYNGDGETNVPAGLSNAVAVAGGYAHSLALCADGHVAAWGIPNDWGQTAVPAGLSNAVQIAAGGWHNLALKSDGALVAWGCPNDGRTQIPPAATNILSIAAGGNFNCAVRRDGTVIAWGRNINGETNVPPGLTNVAAVSCGENHTLALKADGSMVAWGAGMDPNVYGYPNLQQSAVPAGLSNLVSVAAGGSFSLALRNDGTVVAWGENIYAQTYLPTDLTNVVALASGAWHALALVGDAGSRNPPPLRQTPQATGRVFTSTVNTAMGRDYVLAYKDSLTQTNWTTLPIALGNGGPKALADTNANTRTRFYQVRRLR